MLIIFFVIFITLPFFVFTIIFMVSPRFRANILKGHVKTARYVVEENKNDLEVINTTIAQTSKNATKMKAQAFAEGLKEGIKSENTIYCKHCGSLIDNDSKFCKNCGKEL